MTEKQIREIIEKDSWMMEILEITRKLDLPDWWIGAGFVRSKVWDFLHGYTQRTAIPDIDVIYFDKSDTSENKEKIIEQTLYDALPKINWSVKNQARMHILHNDTPYKNSTEGLSRWVETATCIGVTLDANGDLSITAPNGIEDLTHLVLRPTPNTNTSIEIFHKRINDKNWLKKWPKLKVVV